ncbi:hypothetical protein DW094_11490 [Ruminococcaceae bacterium AM07-15]|nr:hypothetical protein DW094_11490 [Ruminococcaceae bacterium AM07-15]
MDASVRKGWKGQAKDLQGEIPAHSRIGRASAYFLEYFCFLFRLFFAGELSFLKKTKVFWVRDIAFIPQSNARNARMDIVAMDAMAMMK